MEQQILESATKNAIREIEKPQQKSRWFNRKKIEPFPSHR